MAIHVKNTIILYKCLIINCTIGNAFESQFNTGYTLIIKAMCMWQHTKMQQLNRAIVDGSPENFGETKQLPVFSCMNISLELVSRGSPTFVPKSEKFSKIYLKIMFSKMAGNIISANFYVHITKIAHTCTIRCKLLIFFINPAIMLPLLHFLSLMSLNVL